MDCIPSKHIGSFTKICDILYIHKSTCNTYVFVVGGHALVIDPGNGRVFEYLHHIGVTRLDTVIVTSHKRTMSAGVHVASKLYPQATVLVPKDEMKIFIQNDEYWQNKTVFSFRKLDSSFDAPIHGAACEGIDDGDAFSWQGINFTIIKTPGVTKGAITVTCELEGQRLAFCGGLCCAGGKVWSLYDFQWYYLPGPLFEEWLNSLDILYGYGLDILYPGFGDSPAATESIPMLKQRVLGLKALMFPNRMPSTNEPGRQLLPHLYYVSDTTFLLVSDRGNGLVVDYGLVNDEYLQPFVDKGIVKTIDRIVITHCHYDHYARAIELKYKSFSDTTPTTETEIWTINEMADVFENALAYYDVPCVIAGGMEIDRIFASGDSVYWEGYKLTFYHHPGQTWYALGLLAEIDGYKVLFTGDINWPIENGRTVTPVIFKNILPNSYVPLAEEIRGLNPDFIAASHYGMFKVDNFMLDSYVQWAKDLELAFADISAHEAHRYSTDCAFARLHPYYQKVSSRDDFTAQLTVRNHHDREVEIMAAIDTQQFVEPLTANTQKACVPVGEKVEFDFRFRLKPGADKRTVITAEITIDGNNFGQVCECMIEIV